MTCSEAIRFVPAQYGSGWWLCATPYSAVKLGGLDQFDRRAAITNINRYGPEELLVGGPVLDSSQWRERGPRQVGLQLGKQDATLRGPPWSKGVTSAGNDAGFFRKARYEEKAESAILSKLDEEGELRAAVEELDLQVQQGCYIAHKFFYSVLKRCIAQKDLALGRRIHALAVEYGDASKPFLANHIIGMYASHGRLEEAMQVFTKVAAPNGHVWASIISAYARLGQPTEAIELYRQMRKSNLKPESHLFSAALKACATAADLSSGKEVHIDILRSGVQPDIFLSSSLVDMYSKCGSLKDARRVFDRLPIRNVVTWTAMITGYVQHGQGQEALALYATMQQEGTSPANHVTFLCLLQACASVGALHQGKQLHAQIQERGFGADVLVGHCLVDMYAKCGCVEDARRVLDKLPGRDVLTWTSLLNGYAQLSDGPRAIECFEEMQGQGVVPDDTTFSCLLVACSHAGLVQEGKQYFKMMHNSYGIVPTDYHYSCMVDLLARSGHLDEAENMLQSMPYKSSVVGWTALLSACKSHGDAERGRRCFDHLTESDPEYASAYVILGNLYADAGRWRDVDEIESLRKAAGAWKKPAKACIEVRNKVHEFTVGEDGSHVSSKLRSVNLKLKVEGGHVPRTELVLRSVSQNEKEDALCGHAEKVALAFGLMNTPDGTTLLVSKNLRMCGDCHSSTKIMSRLEKREVIVRDANRVHRFLDGSCSCGDRP